MNKRGFTLIEVFFVLAVIIVLLSLILPSFRGLSDEADLAKVKGDLALLKIALDTYAVEKGGYTVSV